MNSRSRPFRSCQPLVDFRRQEDFHVLDRSQSEVERWETRHGPRTLGGPSRRSWIPRTSREAHKIACRPSSLPSYSTNDNPVHEPGSTLEESGSLGELSIMPKHVYAGKDFNLINIDFPVVSGPYRLERSRRACPSRWNAARTTGTADAQRNKEWANFQRPEIPLLCRPSERLRCLQERGNRLYPVSSSRSG